MMALIPLDCNYDGIKVDKLVDVEARRQQTSGILEYKCLFLSYACYRPFFVYLTSIKTFFLNLGVAKLSFVVFFNDK